MVNDINRLLETYGKNILISQVKGYNIVHLDNPTNDQIKERIKEVEEGHIDDDLDDNCPACQMLKGKTCDIVYIDTEQSIEPK